jgi:hypothetical protein
VTPATHATAIVPLMSRPALAVATLLALAVTITGPAAADGLSSEDLARKNERGYLTGVPLAAYSTDIGLGGGARLYYYWNGTRSDPRFGRTPYLHRLFVQAFASTKGIQFHWIDYDAPSLLGSPLRVRSQLILLRNLASNYFGIGEAAMARLAFPGADRSFDDFAAYSDAQRQLQDGMAWTRYDQYEVIRPIAIASVERQLLNDRLRLLAGLGVTYAVVRDYTGTSIDAVDAAGAAVDAIQATTRLRADCDAGVVAGCDGGRDHFLRLGVAYDTRDFEPDPNRGVFLDLALDLGTALVGSEYDYARVLATARGWWSPLPADLVLAGRALLQVQSADTPFFAMSTMPFTDDPRAGLGGHRTMRGFRQDRFVGPVMALVNAEVRWTFARTRLWKQRLGFIVAPFVDVGRAADDLGGLAARWRPSGGAALRLSWNLATLVTVDYGKSGEDSGLYVNFGHMF